MGVQKKRYLQRASGIELLKVAAIVIIVISHMTQTWFVYTNANDFVANMDGQKFVLIFFRHFGTVGNLIFFVCSAWFLLDKDVTKKQKVMQMIIDIWLVSVCFLVVPLVTKADFISKKLLIQVLTPTIHENNWYLTSYILFYLLFPFLNMILRRLNQKTHLRFVLVLGVLYLVINNITIKSHFYSSTMVAWITIYFIIAYMKQYQSSYQNNVKRNVLILCISGIALVGFLGFICFVCSKFSLSDNWLLHWNKANNPIIIVMAISALNVARQLRFKSVVVNYLSSLSLLIYIIHENLIFRDYYRKYMYQFIFAHFHPHRIWAWILLLSLVLLLVSIVASSIYALTLQRLTRRFSVWMLSVVKKTYLKVEDILLHTHSE